MGGGYEEGVRVSILVEGMRWEGSSLLEEKDQDAEEEENKSDGMLVCVER